jgi:hypothetical protein
MSANWDDKARQIQHRINVGDKNFVSWSVVVATMHVGEQAPYIAKERLDISHLGVDVPDSNMAHQLYHLSQWMGETGKHPTGIASVVEIGGGYGSMYHLWRKMGFAGRYHMYDYEPMIVLQSRYCDEHGLVRPEAVEGDVKADILIACFSLSEMTLEERSSALREMQFDHFLVAYMPVWDGVDNESYFSSWGGTRINHPYISNVVYLVK